MKKLGIFLMLLMAIVIRSHYVFAQSATITLMPGWNWISVPLMDTLDFETALGSFTPMPGDIIKSQWSNATYMSNGQWRGPISQFYPGYGYMYYSNRVMPVMVTFNAQQPAPQVIVTTMEPMDITVNSATCGGNVASGDGNYVFVMSRGICWSTNPNPTFNDDYVEVENGMGSFTAPMTDLTIGVTYYVRAFAVTANGTFYGNEVSLTTNSEYVDLGLPSGLLWATCNVGAEVQEDFGDYFAWGEIQSKNTYNWITYKYSCNYSMVNKYCSNNHYGCYNYTDTLTILLPEDDVATVNWGNGWRMPTDAEWAELLNNTTCTWTTQNGVNGRLFTASNGKSLFLPASGGRGESSLNGAGSYGEYWSSSLNTWDCQNAYRFTFDMDNYSRSHYNRYWGYSVRPVRSAPQN